MSPGPSTQDMAQTQATNPAANMKDKGHSKLLSNWMDDKTQVD